MEYRVEALAAAAGVRVDTVRFYQTRGLLPKPKRRGRVAIYEAAHLERLRRIRELLEQGFTLAQIERVLDHDAAEAEPLLEALVEQGVGQRTLSRGELAREAGVPEALIQAAEAAQLIEPLMIDGEPRFAEADVEMGRAALAILGAGFPLNDLLQLSIEHARNVREVADAAIDLFDDHVRKGDTEDSAVTEAFRTLMPQVTRLVALHFQRTLVGRALERLATAGEGERAHLEQALADTARRLEVQWR
jgi:DNA-binding transcriptional MerR regulator